MKKNGTVYSNESNNEKVLKLAGFYLDNAPANTFTLMRNGNAHTKPCGDKTANEWVELLSYANHVLPKMRILFAVVCEEENKGLLVAENL